MKAIRIHVDRFKEHNRKRAAENESLRIMKREIFALQVNRSRPKRSGKDFKVISESRDEQ